MPQSSGGSGVRGESRLLPGGGSFSSFFMDGDDGDFPRSVSLPSSHHASKTKTHASSTHKTASTPSFSPFSSTFPRGPREKQQSSPKTSRTSSDLPHEEKKTKCSISSASPFSSGVSSSSSSSDLSGVGRLLSPSELLEPLHASNVPPGSLLLGVVAEIHSSELLIHLPCGLMGYVARVHTQEEDVESGEMTGRLLESQQGNTQSESSSSSSSQLPLTRRFYIGQTVQCVVLSNSHSSFHQSWKRREQEGGGGSSGPLLLSLRPSLFNAGFHLRDICEGMVLPASIISIEEHGYLLSFGVRGNLSGFLPDHCLVDPQGAPRCPQVEEERRKQHDEGGGSDSKKGRQMKNKRNNEQEGGMRTKEEEADKTGGEECKMSEEENIIFSKEKSKLPVHSVLSVRVTKVNEAARVVMCDLPGSEQEERGGSPHPHQEKQQDMQQEDGKLGKGSNKKELKREKNQRKDENKQDNASRRAGLTLNSSALLSSKTPLDWSRVRPGYLVEARVTEMIRETDLSSFSQRRGRAGKEMKDSELYNSSMKKKKAVSQQEKSLNEEDELRGLRVTCLGGLPGVVLQQHLLHPLSHSLSLTEGGGSPEKGKTPPKRKKAKEESLQTGKEEENEETPSEAFSTCTSAHSSEDDVCPPADSLSRSLPPVGERHLRMAYKGYDRSLVNQITSCSIPSKCKVIGRIVAILPQTRRVYLCLLPHIVSWSSISFPCIYNTKSSPCSSPSTEEKQEKRPSDYPSLLLPGTRLYGPGRVLATSFKGHDLHVLLLASSSSLKSEKNSNPLPSSSTSSSFLLSVRLPGRFLAKKDGEKKSEKKNKALVSSSWSPGEAFPGEKGLRVFFLDRFNGEVVAGNTTPLMQETLLTPFDAQPGALLVGTVTKVLVGRSAKAQGGGKAHSGSTVEDGVVVSLSPHVSAFVPLSQLSDVPLSSMPPHITEGSVLKVRVLQRACCASCSYLDGPINNNYFFFLPSEPLPLLGAVHSLTLSRLFGSSLMGTGGGGGGRLLLTAKKAFLKDGNALLGFQPRLLTEPSAECLSVASGWERHGRQFDMVLHSDRHACPPRYLSFSPEQALAEGAVVTGFVQEIRYRGERRHNSSQRFAGPESSELPFVTLGFVGGLRAQFTRQQVSSLIQEDRNLKVGALIRVRIVSISTSCRSVHITPDLSSPLPDHSSLAGSLRGGETGKNLLKPGHLIAQDSLRLLVATEQGLFVSVAVTKGGVGASKHGEVKQSKGQMSMRGNPGKSEADHKEVMLGFVPKLHLSDEVRLAEELFDLLELGEPLPLDAVVLSSASAVRPGAPLRVWSATGKIPAGGRGRAMATADEDFQVTQLAELLSQRLQQPIDGQSDPVVVRDICILSCKPSLIGSAAAGSFLEGPWALEAFAARSTRPKVMLGYVRRVGPFGLLLSFGAWQLTGLVPHSYISDSFIAGTEDGHLQRMYREGMTVRGTIVSVHERQSSAGKAEGKASREKEADGVPSAKGAEQRGDRKGGGGEDRPLQFLVDIRPERLSYLQRQQQTGNCEKTKEGIGVRVLTALLDQKGLATKMKRAQAMKKEPLVNDSEDNTNPVSPKQIPDFRVGQLAKGRVTQVLQSCLLVQLYEGVTARKGDAGDTEKGANRSTKQSVTGVVLQHQLAEGDTFETLQKQLATSADQEGKELERFFVVLDVDPVTGIVDLSCRRQLLEPLLSLKTALASGAKRFKYVHFRIEFGGQVHDADHRDRASTASLAACDITDTGSADVSDVGNAKEKNRDIQSGVVITRILSSIQRASKTKAKHLARKPGEGSSLSPEGKNAELTSGDTWDLEHCVVPDEVLECMHKLCASFPPRSAEVQVENTAYAVLVADVKLSVYFSDCESTSSSLDRGHAAHTAKFPLFLVTLSCRNNTLQPVQPSVEAFQVAGVGRLSGASVLLSPLVKRHSLSRLLVADCCWEPRQQQLVESQQRKAAHTSRDGQLVKMVKGAEPPGSRKGQRGEDRKAIEACTLENIEREVVPGAVLRCRLTFVGPTVALGRIQKPRQQLLLRLHAADALPAPAQYNRLRVQQSKVGAKDAGSDPLPRVTVPNPLKKLSPGSLLEVRVLRVRRKGGGSRGARASASKDVASEETAAKRRKSNGASGNTKSALEDHGSDEAAAGKDEWIADVTLSSTECGGGEERTAESAEDEASTARKKEADGSAADDILDGCLWAVVEKVGPRFLKIQCGRAGCQLLSLSDPCSSDDAEEGGKKDKICHDSGGCLLNGGTQLVRGRVDWFDACHDPSKALLDSFEIGDMVCVKPMPVLKCPRDSVEAARSKPGSQKDCGDRADDETEPGSRGKKRAAVLRRFMVVSMNANSGSSTLSGKGRELTNIANLAQTLRISRSLTQAVYTSSEAALTAWCEWRHPVNTVVWGLVHHFLQPPFAVAVQLSTAVLAACGAAPKDSATKRKRDELETRKGSASHCVAQLPVLAAVHITELTDEWSSDPVKRLKLKVGQVVKLRLLPVLGAEQVQQEMKQQKAKSRSGLPLEASMRLSVVEGSLREHQGKRKAPDPGDQHSLQFSDLEVGQTLSGIVVSSGQAGVFFAINRSLTLRVKLNRLLSHGTAANSAVKPQGESGGEEQASSGLVTGEQAKSLFPVGRLVQNIRVVHLEPATKHVEGSLRQDSLRKRRSPDAVGDQAESEDGPGDKKQKTEAVDANDMNTNDTADTKSHTSNPLFNRLSVGDILDGRVRAVETFGVFVRLQEGEEGEQSRKFVDALCHVSEMGGRDWKERRARLQRLQKGDVVRARVTKKDIQQGRICVSLDPEVFKEDDSDDTEDDEESLPGFSSAEDESLGTVSAKGGQDGERSYKRTGVGVPERAGDDNGDDIADELGLNTHADEDAASDEEGLLGTADATQCWSSCFSADPGSVMDWGTPSGVSDAQGEEALKDGDKEIGLELSRDPGEDLDAGSSKKEGALTRRQREQEARDEDANVRLMEENASVRSWMEDPKSPADFERLLLVNGNSAAVWISYMAFYLKQNELNMAREIAERAVSHINYREEQERCSAWIAYLNLECVYGNRVEDVFKRAVQYNDAKKIYYQMTFIYEKANQLEEARQMCEKCCDKYPESQKMWVRRLTLLYSRLNAVTSARDLILHALFRLPRRKHVTFVATCARLEYKHGSKERGQTYFEKLLAEHPKRTDIWSQYLDAHIAAHTPPRCVSPNLQSIRVLFERMTSLNLKLRKMKFFFTRWLIFEKQHGTPETQTLVRAKAREYVQGLEARIQQET
ncbi:pre-rrna processing protein [Cystoisospora suis]|uniref:Pre-rrna processing protein n=1 Tax=Cystoisospora suis TaxID=483139 RepID=A0A2C6L523_9APIC|nr:pre-rrna processing protein [Cystoisospora suis]